MSRYRSIPTEVDAEQWFPGKAVAGVHADAKRLNFIDRDGCHASVPIGEPSYYVVTIHGRRADLDPGDWVITEPDGSHHYPCKPDIFEKKYRPAESANKIEGALAKLRERALTSERATTANLNDVVRFRIRRDRLALFADNPDVRIARMPCDPTADVPAEAQLHALIRALAPHIGPTFDCPIHTDIEMLTG